LASSNVASWDAYRAAQAQEGERSIGTRMFFMGSIKPFAFVLANSEPGVETKTR